MSKGNQTRKLKELKASFPNAKTATDEEVLAFGAQFVKDYAARLTQELDQFQMAVELRKGLGGFTETPKNQALGLALRQGLINTLERLAELVKGKVVDGDSN